MTVLVTGTGFLGSYVVQRFAERGEKLIFYGTFRQQDAIKDVVDLSKVVQVRGDMMDMEALRTTANEKEVDKIVHTAGVLISGARDNPYLAVKTNVLGIAHVLEVARQTDAKKVVFSGSGQVYGMLNPYQTIKASGPVPEDAPVLPGNVYGTTKLCAEFLGLNYANIYGIDFISLRMPTVYGPWLGDTGRAGVVREMIEAALGGKSLEVNEYISEWAHVRDMANSCLLACNSKNRKDRIFNVGSGTITSLHEFLAAIKRHVPAANITVKEVKMPERQPGDMTKAKQQLGYQPEYGIERAIKDFIDWSKRHLSS